LARDIRYFEVDSPDVEDRLGDRDRVLGRDEDAEMLRDARRRGEPAADAHREPEPLGPVVGHLAGADEVDAVDLGRVALVGARRHRDLVLARQVEVLLVGDEVVDQLARYGRQSNSSVASRPATGAAGHVADGVAAAALRGQPTLASGREDLRAGP
jgi:hypothetical protein